MLHVPDHVREEDQEGDRPAEPDPGPREGASLRAQQDADHQGERVDRHRVLVLQAEAGEKAEPQPQLLVAGPDDADEDVRAPRPEQRLECVHREEVVHHDVDEGERARDGREAHREPPAAHLAGQEAGQEDEGGAGEGRGEPHREERGAERVPDEPGHDGDERRLIHVAPVEVLAAGHEVQLVAEVPVAGGAGEVQQQLRRRDREHDAESAGEPRLRACHRCFIRQPRPPGSRGNGPPVRPRGYGPLAHTARQHATRLGHEATGDPVRASPWASAAQGG